MRLSIYRYVPDTDQRPRMQDVELPLRGERMLLDVLESVKALDPSFSYRRSCREGVCGSDAMNINGRNGLACITNIRTLKEPVVLKPLPGFPVVRDLVVDMTRFFLHYHAVKPYLQPGDEPPPDRERPQTPEERDSLNGLYECILCACCTSSCPSYWWNPDRFLGPAALLQAARFLQDTRDRSTDERLDQLNDAYRLYRCRVIMNCADVCPKGLNPARAIEQIRQGVLRRSV
jgi:succinate dehydrogenase / fumarate reductase iron-sulfur subunit